MDVRLQREVTLELRGSRPAPNLTVSVAAYTAAGDGPWSLPVPLEPWRPGNYRAMLSPLHHPHEDLTSSWVSLTCSLYLCFPQTAALFLPVP